MTPYIYLITDEKNVTGEPDTMSNSAKTSSSIALTCIRPVRAVSFAFYNSGSRAKEGQSDSL
jgi:hypothetical protein